MDFSWKDVGSIAGKFAPLIGTALAGPAGGAVGSLIATAFGTENSPDEVIKALETNPDVAIRLKEIQVKHEEFLVNSTQKMADLDFKYEESRIENIKSARDREVNVAANGGNNWIQPALAIIGVLAFFIFSAYIIVEGLPEMDKDQAFIAGMVVSAVMMIGKDIYHYYFGSSSGSKQKTNMLSAKK